ncbi:MAG TPA: sulfatase-like hydrolase/transferase [Polyangia bacterium]|jgi:arylsulfatase A-like enzyme/HEAT repeat protein|nr:sulfatase-like hydrolase/transferase [Polyangia bacterium]
MTAPGPAAPANGAPCLAWVRSGILGGALAGAFDAALALGGRIGGLSGGKALRFVAVDVALLAFVGLVVGGLGALTVSVAVRTRAPARTAGLCVALFAAPLIGYDAFALFTGHRAAGLPFHQAISVALAAGGLLGVFAFVRRFSRRQVGRRPHFQVPTALVLFGVASLFANRLVLPRLYGWFHLTLAVATLMAFVLALRLFVRGGRGLRVALLAAVTVVAAAAGLVALRGSQVLRYAVAERTALGGLAMRALPVGRGARAVTSGPRSAAADLPPLPEGPRRPQADVLVITIDALRFDHVGAYGYARNTTPNIDALAAGGTRFTRVYSQAPHTSFSVSSMLTSKYFPTMARLAPGERHDTIAAVLRNYGWKTAAFFPPAVFFVDSDKLKAFAESYFDFEYVKFEYIDAQRRVDQLLAYYDTVKPKRSFVWVHFFEPHEPYVTHPGFEFGAGDLDRYDSEIAYTDAAVGRLVKEVRSRRPGTIVILAADHGEEFDEHGGRYHGSSLYEEQLRIPLIVSIPGVAPHVVGGQVQLLDVTPTVLNLLDISVPARMRGTDLGPWLATPPAPAARLPPAFAELEDKRMVSLGGEKLICDMRLGFCAYYDLTVDPHERHNLADERPERAAFLRGLLDHWLDAHLDFEPTPVQDSAGSSPAEGLGPKALERGRLGELGAAPALAALMRSRAPLAERREAAELLVVLPPQAETRAALAEATKDPDPAIASAAVVGSFRLGDAARRARVAALVADPQTPANLRVRAALALATAGDGSGIPVLAEALDRRDDILLCRLIIDTLGKLGDRRAVPILLAHLPEVQNRREMVAALGELGDPAAVDPLLDNLQHDAYVPVRAEAARSLAKIERTLRDRRVIAALEQAARRDTEPMVIAAAREAAATLGARAR